jgi:uncharacterized protein (DUF1800 family)
MLGPQLPESEWTLEAAAHLLNRAAFGGAPHHIQMLHRMGHEKAVDFILTKKSDSITTFNVYKHCVNSFSKRAKDPQLLESIQNLPQQEDWDKLHYVLTSWAEKQEDRHEARDFIRHANKKITKPLHKEIMYLWLRSIFTDPFCSKDKLALFWHSHFPVDNKRRQGIQTHQYVTSLRELGGGNFLDLLKVVCKGWLMADYLDLNENSINSLNENFARELMELFTLGEGNYTENDIREISRVFTGFDFSMFGHLSINKNKQDTRTKTIFGRSNHFTPDDVFEMIANKKECSELIATKLWRYYVSAVDEVSSEELGKVYRNCGMVTVTFLKHVFLSQNFYSKKYVGTHIKTPIHLAAQAVKQLEIPWKVVSELCVDEKLFESMNHVLFAPPNVKGWPNGTDWINPATLLARYRTVRRIIDFVPAHYLDQLLPASSDMQRSCDFISALLFNAPSSPKLVEKFVAFTNKHSYDLNRNKKELLSLLMSTPQYQLT